MRTAPLRGKSRASHQSKDANDHPKPGPGPRRTTQVAHAWELLWWGPTLLDVFGAHPADSAADPAAAAAAAAGRLEAALPRGCGAEDKVAPLEALATAARTTPPERMAKAAPYSEVGRAVEVALGSSMDGPVRKKKGPLPLCQLHWGWGAVLRCVCCL